MTHTRVPIAQWRATVVRILLVLVLVMLLLAGVLVALFFLLVLSMRPAPDEPRGFVADGVVAHIEIPPGATEVTAVAYVTLNEAGLAGVDLEGADLQPWTTNLHADGGFQWYSDTMRSSDLLAIRPRGTLAVAPLGQPVDGFSKVRPQTTIEAPRHPEPCRPAEDCERAYAIVFRRPAAGDYALITQITWGARTVYGMEEDAIPDGAEISVRIEGATVLR